MSIKVVAATFKAALAVSAALVLATASALAAETSTASKYTGAAVTVEKAKKSCFSETIAFTGVLVPREEVPVRPDREGLQVTAVNAEIGDVVTSNQLLAQLSAPDGSSSSASVDIRAPSAGIILKSQAVIGALASARAEPMFLIVAHGEFEMLAQLSAKNLTHLTVGQVAKINVLGVGAVQGRVRLIPATIDGMTQLGQVRIFIGKDPRLRVGAFARGVIATGERCGVTIPLSAILYGQDSTIVAVVVGSELIETRQISIGGMSEGEVEVREGLAEGDLVVVRAGAFVREGDRVRPVLAGTPPKK